MFFRRIIQQMKPAKKQPIAPLKTFMRPNCLEVGVDEVARGCLAGRVYASAVVWNSQLEHPLVASIKDSKKLTPMRRSELRQFIEQSAIAWSVGWVDEHTIDSVNIRNATFMAMHQALDNMSLANPNLDISHILVDGNAFQPYRDIEHSCVVKGDNTYLSIACASILAKTHRDEYLASLARTYPDLHKYGWYKNNAYGTRDHLDAIRTHGISQFHRRTFGICKGAPVVVVQPNLTFVGADAEVSEAPDEPDAKEDLEVLDVPKKKRRKGKKN
jgi:ribonuclease HII